MPRRLDNLSDKRGGRGRTLTNKTDAEKLYSYTQIRSITLHKKIGHARIQTSITV